MTTTGDAWWWGAAVAATIDAHPVALNPLALAVLPAPIDVRLASEDRPVGLTAKVFRGTDHRHPVATLTAATERGGQIRLSDAGEGHLTVANRHSDRDTVACDDIVRFELDGRAIHQWVVTDQQSATVREAPADQVTTMAGPGVLGLWAEAPVFPSLGVDRQPVERDRIWSWVSPSPIYDDSSWDAAVELTSGVTDWWNGVSNFPGGLASGLGSFWIWGRPSDYTWAPPGDCYFRRTFTVATATRYAFFFVADDRARVWIDGVEQIRSESWDNSNGSLFAPQFDLSAGDHTIAVWANNNPGGATNNPSGVRGVLCPVTPTGEVSGAPALVTDDSWKVLSYPASPPGMTVGEVLIGLLAEWQDMGFMTGWDVTFSATHDSQGLPWPVGEFGTKVGTDGRTFLVDELAGTYIDVRASNGGLVLDATVKDTLGTTRTLTLEGPTGRDPATGNLLELSHDRAASRGNCALVLTGLGWQFVDETPDGARRRGVTIGLGAQPTKDAAAYVARGELGWMGTTSEAITAGFRPRNIGERPDRSCDVGDTITVPSWTGTPSAERLLSWTFTEDEHGTLTWAPELKSVRASVIERHEAALKKMADGTVRGTSTVATPTSSIDTADPTCCPPAPVIPSA
jgi:hypothetical protein